MNILLINTTDKGGGAEKVGYDLFQKFRESHHDAKLYVRDRHSENQNSIGVINPYEGCYFRSLWESIESITLKTPEFRGKNRLINLFRRISYPRRMIDKLQGIEDFNYPYSYSIGSLKNWKPNVINAHNLHADYFDLRALPKLSFQVPFIWTLHDTWAITGHCAYFIDCNNWLKGCGSCPDLRRPPAIYQDSTGFNWKRKSSIYSKSKLIIVTPSNWLMNCVNQSMLMPWQTRIIPNGVDTNVYKPSDHSKVRSELGLPQDRFICLFVAYSGSGVNPYKDYLTVESAIHITQNQDPNLKITFLCIGGDQKSNDDNLIRYIGYLNSEQIIKYYQAADVLLHAANAENFPLVLLESLACGTPVIATSVGGIPEIIQHEYNGFLIPRGSNLEMAKYIIEMTKQPILARNISDNAIQTIRNHFDLHMQVQAYLDLFKEITEIFSI